MKNQKEIKEQLLHYFNNKNKNLGINLASEVKDLYLKNCTTMVKKKKIEDDTTGQKINCVHALEEYC